MIKSWTLLKYKSKLPLAACLGDLIIGHSLSRLRLDMFNQFDNYLVVAVYHSYGKIIF